MFHIVFFLFVIDMRGCILIWLVLFKSIFATIYKTKLYAQGSDNDESYENKFITGSFEGPTLYFFLGANELAITFTYDDILKSAWVSYQNVNYYLHVDSLGAFIANTDDIASFESQFFVNSSNLKRANLGSFYYYTKLANEGSSNTSSTQYPFLLTDKWNPDKSYRFFNYIASFRIKMQ